MCSAGQRSKTQSNAMAHHAMSIACKSRTLHPSYITICIRRVLHGSTHRPISPTSAIKLLEIHDIDGTIQIRPYMSKAIEADAKKAVEVISRAESTVPLLGLVGFFYRGTPSGPLRGIANQFRLAEFFVSRKE